MNKHHDRVRELADQAKHEVRLKRIHLPDREAAGKDVLEADDVAGCGMMQFNGIPMMHVNLNDGRIIGFPSTLGISFEFEVSELVTPN